MTYARAWSYMYTYGDRGVRCYEHDIECTSADFENDLRVDVEDDVISLFRSDVFSSMRIER